MTVLSDYVTGTISLTTGSVDFTGSATGWLLAAFKEGDTIIDITGATEFMGVIAEITSNTAGKLTKAWEGPDLVDAPYRMRYQADGSRVSAQARNLIELLGDGTLTSLAGLTGPGVIELLPGGGAKVVPKTDLVSGANYDVQVSDLAGRTVYDGQAEGFSVLVADVGDGRSAIYSKASNASADWTDPAYVTGPVGETPDVTIGTVSTGAPGTDAEVTATPITGGVELDFTIPAGEGFSAKGAYSGATAYAKGDVVRDAGSSWIALQATTGNAPPTLPTTSNAYWELLAQKGLDGLGTGDMTAAVYDPTGVSADAFDSSYTKFLQAGTGAVVTEVQSKLRQTISVMDFGATGDGTTDDTAAFKAARDYLQTNSDYRGGTIFIPKGRYKLTDEIAFTSYVTGSVHNIYIQGAGILATALDFSDAPAGTNGISFNAGVHFGLADLMITGAKKNGINIDGVADFAAMFTLERLRVQNSTSNGIYVRNAWLQTYKDIWSVSNGANGFVFTGFHTSIKAERCFASLNSSGSGFAINAVTYGSFITCASDANQRGYALSNLNGVSFIACGTEGNANDGWLLRTSDALSAGVLVNCENIRGVSFLNCFNLGNGTATPGAFATFMTLTTANSRPIEISIEGCTSWRDNVADPAIVAAGTSGTIAIHEKMNAFDGAWSTSGVVRRNTQSGSAIHLTGGANSYQVGTWSSTGATRGTLIDATTFSHSGTGTGAEFVGAFYNANGLVGSIQTSGSATSYNTSSDENLKDFIGEMDPARAIEIILADPVREFTWKADGQAVVGWGAQTSYAVSPDLATPGRGDLGDEDFLPWGVDQSKRTPYLWAAVTYLLKEVAALRESQG